MGQPVGTTVDCKTVCFFSILVSSVAQEPANALPGLALRFIV